MILLFINIFSGWMLSILEHKVFTSLEGLEGQEVLVGPGGPGGLGGPCPSMI